ncbi:hypothetical protein H257_19003 [Aphanomyces astaci]|uniref:Tektin n=1 Tax=Aphanomyces astaci TaxID=112090 RepID=W4FAX5_APHAT|nr:hypothetical protein H257_19003 [Aphanomyces astaci]ETV64054.1 hypothetical protein H257_19003 [Aphanomyces astaci]|eukprot:XP_009846462.1 hypothetical protein H257_19003 [Aphanomyces astaci]
MEVLSPAVSALLNNLSHRILKLDTFLEDSLDQAHVRIQALTDEIKVIVHIQKRKIAEAKLMAIIHDATVTNAGEHLTRTQPPSSTLMLKSQLFSASSQSPLQLIRHPHRYWGYWEVSELSTALSEAQAQLDSARRDVQVLKADVDMFGDAMFQDHQRRLTDELACEHHRVKAHKGY